MMNLNSRRVRLMGCYHYSGVKKYFPEVNPVPETYYLKDYYIETKIENMTFRTYDNKRFKFIAIDENGKETIINNYKELEKFVLC